MKSVGGRKLSSFASRTQTWHYILQWVPPDLGWVDQLLEHAQAPGRERSNRPTEARGEPYVSNDTDLLSSYVFP